MEESLRHKGCYEFNEICTSVIMISIPFLTFIIFKRCIENSCKHQITCAHRATQTLKEDFLLSMCEEDRSDHCDICDIPQTASKYCTQCKQYLCSQCLKVHREIIVTKDHKIINSKNVRDKRLRKRHLALWSTYELINSGDNLIGFSNNENKTGIRFVVHQTGKYGYPYSSETVDLGIINARENKYVSQNEVNIKNLTIQIPNTRSTTQQLFHFVTGIELTYFTFPLHKKVCKMDENMETASVVFITPGHCYGITKFDNGLALVHEQNGSFVTPKWQIHVYTFEGVLKQQILYDKDGRTLFKKPENLSANTKENILYATDTSKQVLYAFDTKGDILFIFQSEVMVAPKGISTDPEGNIYIACKGRVLQIQENGVKYRTLLHMEKGKENNSVEDVYFDRENTQLAVIEDFKHGSVFKFLSD